MGPTVGMLRTVPKLNLSSCSVAVLKPYGPFRVYLNPKAEVVASRLRQALSHSLSELDFQHYRIMMRVKKC
jgi:hypothetical protein